MRFDALDSLVDLPCCDHHAGWADAPECGLLPGRCADHQYDVTAPKCGACKDARIYAETQAAARPALALVSSRPDWCGDCDQFTRLRNYDSVPYRCPECHPLAQEAS